MPLHGGIRQRLGLCSRPSGNRSRSPRNGNPRSDDCDSAQVSGPTGLKLRDNIATLFMENKLSGKICQSIYADAGDAGAVGVEDLGKCGNSGKKAGNIARDMMRKLMRGCKVPPEYWIEVPFKNIDTGDIDTVPHPVLLPHEMLAYMVEHNPQLLQACHSNPGHGVFSHLLTWCKRFDTEVQTTVPIGLHGDGVPFAAKMRDSLECVSWNIITDISGDRFLYTCFPKSFAAGRSTWDALLEVFAWSMKQLMLGLWPGCRHDGRPWQPSDKTRQTYSGRQLGAHAALLQIRGDWAFYKEVFNFPSWRARRCCWRCCAKNQKGETSDFRDASTNANWRMERVPGHAFLAQQRADGIKPSPLFQTPGLEVDMVMIDWLHTMDLGVIADVLGNVFWDLLPFLGTGTQEERVKYLWSLAKHYYKQASVPVRLDNLTLEMIKARGKPPKLRGRAAQVRYLLPFAAQMAEMFADESEHCRTLAIVTDTLLQLTLLNQTTPYQHEAAAGLSRQLALLLTGLEAEALLQGNDCNWRTKPKLHLMQELIEYQCFYSGAPCQYWTYTDESWGGWLAKAGMRRGGKKTAPLVGLNVINRFRYMMDRQRR